VKIGLLILLALCFPFTLSYSQSLTDPCVKAFCDKGNQEFNQGNYNSAIEKFKNAKACPLATEDNKREIDNKITQCYIAIGENDLRRANLAYENDEYDLAIEYYKKVQKNPSSAYKLTDEMEDNIARCWFGKVTQKAYQAKNQKQYETAITFFSEALKINRIQAYEQAKVRTQINECQKLSDYQSGIQEQQKGSCEEAVKYYQMVLENPAVTSNEQISINQRIKECEEKMILDIEMVYVEGGTFEMGSNDGNDDEKPAHKVTLNSFYIGKYEVTQKQWQAIMGNNPSFFLGCDNCPIEEVSWDDVQEFIRKLNQKTGKMTRLPTEAEWEYAARGGNNSQEYKFAGTSNYNELHKYANFCDMNCENSWKTVNQNDGYRNIAPVGEYLPNELGIYDMSGNVWEWCSDFYSLDYYSNSPRYNPENNTNAPGRVYRGGSWFLDLGQCQVVNRNYWLPNYRSNNLGFRLLRKE